MSTDVIKQSGTVTPGHVPSWTTEGVIQDGGTAASGRLTSLGVTGQGLGICQNSAAIDQPYNRLCLGVNTNSAAQLSLQALNGATPQDFQFVINGSTYTFPFSNNGNVTGPGSSTINDLVVFNNTAGTLVADSAIPVVSNQISSAFISFLQSGTGAVLRTLQSKERETVSVTDFGVVCDGVTVNNVALINTALSSSTGKAVTFPAGTTTLIDGPIVIPGAITIKSDGWHAATIKTNSATANIITITLPVGVVNASNICIDNLILDSTVLKTAGWAILVTTVDGGALFFSKFSNLFIGSNCWSGIGIESCLDIVLQNIIINGVGEGGFGMKFGGLNIPGSQGAAGVWIDNCIVNSARTLPTLNYGIQFSDKAEGYYVSRVSIEGPNIRNHLYFANPSANILLAPKNMFFDKTVCDVARFIGIAIEYALTLRFTDCWTTSGDNAAGGGVFVSSGNDIEFKGHTVLANTGYGFQLGATCTQVRILGGMISGNSIGVNVVANCTDFTICGAEFGRGGVATQAYDVLINTGTSDRYIVANNRMQGAVTANISDGGSGTNKVIGPNTYSIANAGAFLNTYYDIREITGPAAPAANTARLYVDDNGGGKTRLMVRFPSGAAQQIAIEP